MSILKGLGKALKKSGKKGFKSKAKVSKKAKRVHKGAKRTLKNVRAEIRDEEEAMAWGLMSTEIRMKLGKIRRSVPKHMQQEHIDRMLNTYGIRSSSEFNEIMATFATHGSPERARAFNKAKQITGAAGAAVGAGEAARRKLGLFGEGESKKKDSRKERGKKRKK